MTDEETSSRARAVVLDALRPIFGPRGIVAAHVVIYVVAEDGLMPIVCSLATSKELMIGTFEPAAEYMADSARRGHDVMHAIPVAAKN